MTAPSGTPSSRWRRELRSFAELLALCGFAIAQPLLDVFGRSPEQFAFRGAEAGDIVRFALVIAFVPPLLLWAGEAAIGLLSQRARTTVHSVLVAALVGAFAVQLLRPVLGEVLLAAAAALLGVGAALLARRSSAFRLWLGYAAFAPFVFVAMFLLTSETSALLDEGEAAPAGATVSSPAPVVMLVLDEFSLTAIIDADGGIDAELYPNLAELAGGSTWFRNATTVSSSTWHAVPSIVTGRYPVDGSAPVAADHPESLFTLLGGTYDMHVTESVTRLCPADLCRPTVPAAGPGELLDDAVSVLQARLSWSGEQGDPVAGLVEAQEAAPVEEDGFADFELNQPARFRALLDGITDDPTALHYLHVLLPHVPYRYLPSGTRYDGPDPDLGRVGDDWDDEPWLVTLGRQRMQLQVAYVDALVGELMATLRAAGIDDDALIVLTGDHGISFQPGGPIRAIEGQSLDEQSTGELLWIPLFVKEPGQTEGAVSDDNVTVVDILPTIADVLGVDLPWSVDGQSMLGPARRDNGKPFHPSDVHDFGVTAAEQVTVDGEAGWQTVLDNAVDRFLPPVGTPDRLWRVGPSPALVGQRVDDVPASMLTEVPSSLTSPLSPLVRGVVDDGPPGAAYAFAVDGVIGATAPTYDDGGQTAFAVMVSDQLLGPGDHTVTVHRIEA